MQCREAGSPKNYGSSYQITLNGTGILLNSSSCYIYSETFKLLPHSFGRSVATLNITHIVLSNVDDILNSVKQGLLQPYSPESTHLHIAEAVLEQSTDLHIAEAVLERATSRSATSGFYVSRITHTLHGERLRHQSSTQASIIGVIALLLSLLNFTFIYFKFC